VLPNIFHIIELDGGIICKGRKTGRRGSHEKSHRLIYGT